MGELVAVLNGVEFRTRHNDYKMRMPSRTSKTYGATEDIPYPNVPPQVLSQPTLELQIAEMREWFKAWKNSDHSKRDYRKYFKPVLCYLEGAWTNAKSGKIDEPFFSERHAIDASSFFELQNKIRYTTATGRKSTKENFAYLPSTIADVDDYGNIIYSQWNYRILCHPVKNYEVPLTRLRLENDLGVRVANGKTFEEFAKQRSARFSLHPDPTTNKPFSTKDLMVRTSRGSFLDLLMAEIPGKDNYQANIVDDAFGSVAYPKDANLPKYPTANTTLPPPLNVGYYHNAYKVIGNDAMGVSIRRRGFSDNNVYIAYNTQEKITTNKVKGKCSPDKACLSRKRLAEKNCRRLKKQKKACPKAVTCPPPNCPVYSHRVSYAIPLEIIYVTPLQSWNPYNLTMFKNRYAPTAKNSYGFNRNGGSTNETAYLGMTSNIYSMTPVEFFETGRFKKTDKADTTRGSFGILDPEGDVRKVTSSGIKIMTRNIPDVGTMRIRYPIVPLHDSGSSIYKDLQALSDLTLKQHKYLKLYPDARFDNGTIEEMFTFELTQSTKTPPGPHTHTFELSEAEIESLKGGEKILVSTTMVAGHEHELLLRWYKNSVAIERCDDSRYCWDGHRRSVSCPDCRFGLGD
ncbi:uncharacterized protein [Watersipora subatra]|uniref:uncharacterized protein n=1 Tax=Watersipora subatra TaxID=2589382 RepID=UPI00355B98A3